MATMKILQSKQQRLTKQKLSPYLPMEEIATHNWEHEKDLFNTNVGSQRAKNLFSKNHFESSISKFECSEVPVPPKNLVQQPKFEVLKVNDEPPKLQDQAEDNTRETNST